MRYTASNIQVKQGETVRFIVKNVGQVKHELSLGTEKELEHLEQMEVPGHGARRARQGDAAAWQAKARSSGSSPKAGGVNFACLMPATTRLA